MDIEENDEVEREIDIVYSGQFSDETKIFQFPLIPNNSMNIEKINSLGISQDMKSMKMDMNIDQKYLDKNNYNAVPIHTLKGEKINNNSNLCLGIMKNNKLILTPISQVFQFRHDFSTINKDKIIQIKGKKDKKEIKNLNLKKEDKPEIKYNPLNVHLPESLDSKIVLERISCPEGQIKKANYMNKDEYFDLLLKYVISPDSGGDANDDFLSLCKNNFSKESNLENINEEDKMIIEENDNKKSGKKRGFNSGLGIIKNNEENGNGIVKNIIINVFGDNECLLYDNLLVNICQKMKISNDDEEKINQIKKEIEDNCIIVKDNICFIKNNNNDNDINKVRNLLIEEIGNNDNGLKKQQIKKLIEQKGLSISDNKLTKLLQKICKYSGSLWVIKPPTNY